MPPESDAVRVAVVIPCYNDGAHVASAVASARAQEPCEIVVIDDGSDQPATIAALDSLRQESVRVVRQANAGLSAARMAGVHATSAPYVHPLDADDRLAPDALKALADALDEQRQASLAWGDLESFGARRCLYRTAPELDPWRITCLTEIPGTPLLRRSALLAVGGWDMGSGYEDWDLFLKGAEHGWIGVRVPRVTLYYREHENGRMYVESRRRHGELRALLRRRHAALFAARRSAWRSSPARWGVKLAWPFIDWLPFVSELAKESLFGLSRDASEPWMAPSVAPSIRRRLQRRLLGYASGRKRTA